MLTKMLTNSGLQVTYAERREARSLTGREGRGWGLPGREGQAGRSRTSTVRLPRPYPEGVRPEEYANRTRPEGPQSWVFHYSANTRNDAGGKAR
jgi:hypothetical protein